MYMIYGKLTMTSPRRHRSDGDYRGNYPQKQYFRLHSIVNDMCIYIHTDWIVIVTIHDYVGLYDTL